MDIATNRLRACVCTCSDPFPNCTECSRHVRSAASAPLHAVCRWSRGMIVAEFNLVGKDINSMTTFFASVLNHDYDNSP